MSSEPYKLAEWAPDSCFLNNDEPSVELISLILMQVTYCDILDYIALKCANLKIR